MILRHSVQPSTTTKSDSEQLPPFRKNVTMKMFWFQFFKAILARILFFIHGFLVVWRVTDATENDLYWLMCLPLCLYLFELTFTWKMRREHMEWRWFSPSVALYLATAVPSIFLLEGNLLNQRLEVMKEQNLESCSDIQLSNNATSLSSIVGVSIRLSLTNEMWALGIEQTMLFLLIFGRWLLPKGELSRDQLSDLLLIYIGMGADILEFIVDSISEDKVACNTTLVYIILSLWAWSLLQYTIFLTAHYKHSDSDEESHANEIFCCQTGTWGAFVILLMQDVPFLIFRLYLIFQIGVISHQLLFYTGKNVLVIILQINRLFIINCSKCK